MDKWINIIGMILELIGLVMVYQIKIKKFHKVEMIDVEERATFGEEWTAKDMIRVLKQDINSGSEKLNREIKSDDKKASKYFLCIFIGFILQLISSVFSLSVGISSKKASSTRKCVDSCYVKTAYIKIIYRHY